LPIAFSSSASGQFRTRLVQPRSRDAPAAAVLDFDRRRAFSGKGRTRTPPPRAPSDLPHPAADGSGV